MSDKQENLTDEEIKDLQVITNNVLTKICVMADIYNIDSLLKYFADMLIGFTNVASIQNYKTNEHTNADRIRNMSDEELAEWINDKNACNQCIYKQESECGKGLCTENILKWLQSEAE